METNKITMTCIDTISPEDFQSKIREAWYTSQPIVPIIGAGFSVDSGMPALASIVRYLAKFRAYLRWGLYAPEKSRELFADDTIQELYLRADKYLDIFGWPDRFQLNADVARGLRGNSIAKAQFARERRPNEGILEWAIRIELDRLAIQINPSGTRSIKGLDLENIVRSFQSVKHFESTHPKLFAMVHNNPSSEGTFQEDYYRLSKSISLLQTQFEWPNSFLYQVCADWKPLLREVTHCRSDLTDALFGSLARKRQPNTSHLFLAHLVQLIGIKTIFTYNFDQLIEAGLSAESVPHQLFSMEHGKTLPSPTHLNNNLALIKMHGSTHNILADERVDHFLTDEYRRSFRILVGDSPLLLLMGCSGNDRRLRDLVTSLLLQSEKASVVWIYRSESPDTPSLEELQLMGRRTQISRYPTTDVGQSLRALYCGLTERLPASSTPYKSQILLPSLRTTTLSPSSTDYKYVSTRVRIVYPTKKKPYAALTFLKQLAITPLSYNRIWVDLEEHYSFAQVVAEIIDQMRKSDSHLSPYVGSWSSSETSSELTAEQKHAVDDAARRVLGAMRRTRYVIAISGLDAFPWQPTTHHGTTRFGKIAEAMETQAEMLNLFLENIVDATYKAAGPTEWEFGNSEILLHWESPYSRHRTNHLEQKELAKHRKCFDDRTKRILKKSGIRRVATVVNELPKFANLYDSILAFGPQDENGSDVDAFSEQDAVEYARSIGIAILSSFRRTRPTVGIRQLFRELIVDTPENKEVSRSKAKISERVRKFSERIRKSFELTNGLPNFVNEIDYWADQPELFENMPIRSTEAGVWFDRPYRDALYDFNTRFTQNDGNIEKDHVHAIAQHLTIAAIHDLIARQYYLSLYLPSKDGFMFFEYVYHRTSCLRYLFGLKRFLSLNAKRAALRGYIHDLGTSRFFKCFAAVFGESFGKDWSSLFGRILAAGKTSLDLAGYIDKIRYRCLKGLAETWRRSEREFRASLPAEQISQWCETLVMYDFWPVDFEDTNQLKHKRRVYCPTTDKNFGTPPNLKAEVQRVVQIVGDTWARVCYERADFLGFERTRKRVSNTLNEISKTTGDFITVYRANIEIDSKVAHHWQAFSSLNSIKVTDPPDFENETSEAWLRTTYLHVETSLAELSGMGKLPVFDKKGVSPESEDLRHKLLRPRLQDLITSINQSIEKAREEFLIAGNDGLRSPMLESTVDKGLFIPYRALFQILLGRVRMYMGLTLTEGSAEHQFRQAFRDIANSRSGIGRENSIVLGLSQLCAAELCLAQVEWKYSSMGKRTELLDYRLIGEIKAKLRACSGYLSRTAYELLQGPRYVLVWRYFHIMQSKYQIERIFLEGLENLINSPQPNKDSARAKDHEQFRVRDAGRLVERTRRGLAAIRSGLDETVPSHRRFRDQMLFSWSQLAMVSFFSGLIQQRTTRLFDSVLWNLASYWDELNKSEAVEYRFLPETQISALECPLLIEPLLKPGPSKFRKKIVSFQKHSTINAAVEMRKWLLNDATVSILRLDSEAAESLRIVVE